MQTYTYTHVTLVPVIRWFSLSFYTRVSLQGTHFITETLKNCVPCQSRTLANSLISVATKQELSKMSNIYEISNGTIQMVYLKMS